MREGAARRRPRAAVGKNYANRLISGSQVAANLSAHADNFNPLVKIQPTSEFQICPITNLDPEQQIKAWAQERGRQDRPAH